MSSGGVFPGKIEAPSRRLRPPGNRVLKARLVGVPDAKPCLTRPVTFPVRASPLWLSLAIVPPVFAQSRTPAAVPQQAAPTIPISLQPAPAPETTAAGQNAAAARLATGAPTTTARTYPTAVMPRAMAAGGPASAAGEMTERHDDAWCGGCGLRPDLKRAGPKIVHTPEAPPAGDVITLSDQELHETPGTFGGEPLRAIQTLPGFATPVSGLGYSSYRGTEPATNELIFDGVRVPFWFHALLLPETVSPELISAVHVYRGNAPVDLPPVLGSAIVADLKHASGTHPTGTATLDLLSLRASTLVPIASTGTEIAAAARFAWSPLLGATIYNARPVTPGTPPSTVSATLADYQASVQQKLGSGAFRLLAFGFIDSGGISSATAAAQPFVASHRIDLRWRQPIGAGELEAGATSGWDRIGGTGGGETSRVSFQVTERSYAARLKWSADLGGVRVLVGADVDHRQSDFEQNAAVSIQLLDSGEEQQLYGTFSSPVATLTRSGAYAQASLALSRGLTLTPAIRVEDAHLVPGIENVSIEPRLTVRAELTDALALRASAGVFTQPPTMVLPLPVAEAWGLANGLQQQLQFNVGADWALPWWGLTASVDGYFNPLLRTVEYSLFDLDFQHGDPTALAQNRVSHGWAGGAELFVRKQLSEHWFGWISYAYEQSVRSESFARYDALGNVIGSDRALLPYAFNQAHVFSAVVSYELPAGWTVGGGLHFNTGAPESGGLASATQRAGIDANGFPAWQPVDRDQVDRLPAFFRVDARVAKTWTLKEGRSIELSLDVLDVSLSKQVVRYNYNANAASLADREAGRITLQKAAYGLPPILLPMLAVKANL